MALTEKMLEKAREQLASSGGRKLRYTPEECVKAYLWHGTLQKAAQALGCSYQTMCRKVHEVLDEK